MELFEKQLKQVYPVVERYVKYRLNNLPDAEDLIQDICLTAYLRFYQLQKQESFKPWILSIARNRCNDYFRKRKDNREISLEALPEDRLVWGRLGRSCATPVSDTVACLRLQDREVLQLFYWQQLSIAEIAEKLGIPAGTVKSRLHTAKAHFKNQYPYLKKETIAMKKLPATIPAYSIEPLSMEPFAVKWEEMMGWFIVPKLGEKLQWAMYDQPEGCMTSWCELEVVGNAEIHGIEGVEITAVQHGKGDERDPGFRDGEPCSFVAQLTDTHSRYLAESHIEGGVRKLHTFLDGEVFADNWGFGPGNCGCETNLVPMGRIRREGNHVLAEKRREVMDVVGAYRVTIGGKAYETVCVMDIEFYNEAVFAEQYIDRNGRTVLWRRFNRDNWQQESLGGHRWSERFPENEQIVINGDIYVHWYDCITDYIL